MSRDVVVGVLKNPWWAIVGLAFTLGGAIADYRSHEEAQDAILSRKADSAEIARLTDAVTRLDSRLRDFICEGKPRYCQ